MTEEAIEARLGDIAEFINGGAWGQSEYAADGIPVVRVTNLRDEGVDLTDCKFLPVGALAKYSKHILRHGDLIIATVGSHPSQPGSVVGRPCVAPLKIDGALLNQNAVLIRTSTEALDQGWLGYFGQSKPFRDYVIGCARGSANQVRMAIGLLKKMPIALPPVEGQRRVASILGAYDDLIEVNRRRIRLLEEMARRLFEEWFVRFGAPECEGLPLVDSKIGPIPQGWQVSRLDGMYETSAGGTPSRECPQYFNGDIRWVKTKELLDGPIFETEEYITKDGLANSSAKLFPAYSVLVGMYGANIAQLGVLLRPAATNQACCAVISSSKTAGWAYAYLTLGHARERLIKLRAGAAQQNISQGLIRALDILQPPNNVLVRFEELVCPMLAQSFIFHHQNSKLAAQRALVLPRIVSGEFAISAAERQLEAVA